MSDTRPLANITSYSRKDWADGEVITETKLDTDNGNIETTLSQVEEALADIQNHRSISGHSPTEDNIAGQIVHDPDTDTWYGDPDGSGADWPLLTGGFESMSNADTTLTIASPRRGAMTPSVTRTITLPTTSVEAGMEWSRINLATDQQIIVESSDGSHVCSIFPLSEVTLMAVQDTPTTELHWRVHTTAPGVPLDWQEASASATLDFTKGFDSRFSLYRLELSKILPETNAVGLFLRISEDGGSNWKSGATDYAYNSISTKDSTTNTAAGNTRIDLNFSVVGGTDSTEGCDTIVESINPSAGNKVRFLFKTIQVDNSTNTEGSYGGGRYIGSSNAVNALRILFSSGNIASGQARLYGII